MYLVFPNLAWAWDKIFFCQKETAQEVFMQQKLPSIARATIEEEYFNSYLSQNQIQIKDTKYSTDTRMFTGQTAEQEQAASMFVDTQDELENKR